MSSKLMIVLLLIVGAIYTVMNSMATSVPVVENFWNGPSFKARVDPSVGSACGQRSIPGAGNVGGAFFTVPGYAQTAISARFSSGGLGAAVQYNMPSVNNMAMNPNNPSSAPALANIVEGFEDTLKVAQNSLPAAQGTAELDAQLSLPAADMNAVTGAAPLVMDRFIFANQKSNLRGAADPIRGDLAIAPCSTGWFRPSVNMSTDLNSGALAVMGGAYNETMRTTAGTMMAANGGTDTTQAGVNFAQPAYTALGRANMASQKNEMGQFGANRSGDVTVSAYA